MLALLLHVSAVATPDHLCNAAGAGDVRRIVHTVDGLLDAAELREVRERTEKGCGTGINPNLAWIFGRAIGRRFSRGGGDGGDEVGGVDGGGGGNIPARLRSVAQRLPSLLFCTDTHKLHKLEQQREGEDGKAGAEGGGGGLRVYDNPVHHDFAGDPQRRLSLLFYLDDAPRQSGQLLFPYFDARGRRQSTALTRHLSTCFAQERFHEDQCFRWSALVCPGVGAAPPTPPTDDASSNCTLRARAGECDDEGGELWQLCRASCAALGFERSEDADTSLLPADNSTTKCKDWAHDGWCEKNPRYMWVSCRRSCAEHGALCAARAAGTAPLTEVERLVQHSQEHFQVTPRQNRAVFFPSDAPELWHWVNKTALIGRRRVIVLFWSAKGGGMPWAGSTAGPDGTE